jgi:GT2 family glycosyltransferase
MRCHPLFSVIMAVYNHEAYLKQAVESVLGQTYTHWELLLIDDGSTDGSPALIDEFARRDLRIRAIHQENAGAAAARNRGLISSRGDWIAYLDSDDLWFPSTLQSYVDHLEQHPQAQFLFGSVHRLVDGQTTSTSAEHQDRPVGTKELFQRAFLRTLAVSHHRELLRKAGGFNPTLRWCEDYELFLRMSLHSPLEPIGRATGLRRRHTQNLSQRSGLSQQAEAEMLHHFALRHPERINPLILAKRLGQVYARAARCFFREGDYTQSLVMGHRALEWQSSWRVRFLCWSSRLAQAFHPFRKESVHDHSQPMTRLAEGYVHIL